MKEFLQIKNKELENLEKEIFEFNKRYSMIANAMEDLPNLYAIEQLLKEIEIFKEKIKELKLTDEFDQILEENILLNLSNQKTLLGFFSNSEETIEEVFDKLIGENFINDLKISCEQLDYKALWEFYLSYQEYAHKRIPSDDESFRETFKKILIDLKKDLLDYATEVYNLDKNYNFELILAQPYTNYASFHPTNKRMEISPSYFFVFKDENQIKINVTAVIATLFHEIIGHARHEYNSRNLPKTVQNNSINTAIVSNHLHFEGVSQTVEGESLIFMRKFKEKYQIEEDYLRQRELYFKTFSRQYPIIYYEFLKLKKFENKNLDIEEEFKKHVKNHGLFVNYESDRSIFPASCIKRATYPAGLKLVKSLLEELKVILGDKFAENKSLINEVICTGVWHPKVLPKFIKYYLKKEKILKKD